jgi:hypothetical protein
MRSRFRLISDTAQHGADKPLNGRLFLRRDWLRVTDCVSQDARRALFLLIRASAELGRKEIPIDVNVLAAHFTSADFSVCFHELMRNQLVREVRPGFYSVAEELWKVGPVTDANFFPVPVC